MGTTNLIEIDDTRFPIIIYDGTFKNKGSRILQLITGWRIKNVFKRTIVFSNPLLFLKIMLFYMEYTLQE